MIFAIIKADKGKLVGPKIKFDNFVMKKMSEDLFKIGIELLIPSDAPLDSICGYILFNYYEKEIKEIKKKDVKMFLVLSECEVVSPSNWNIDNHRYFDEIFTWRDDVDFQSSDKYIRYFWHNNLSRKIDFVPFGNKSKLCAMIACNKWKRRPKELYTERFNAIKWFQSNHPEDFDLYGYDWEYGFFKRQLEKIRNFYRSISGGYCRPVDVSKVYKGSVDSKIETLKPYKFSICYENARSIPGYITEKIFDCFMAGVVPVYMGWEEACKYIPPETFIDRYSFSSYEELYEYIKNITEVEYNSYIHGIQKFLAGDLSDKFRYENYVDIVVSTIKKELREIL